MHARRKPLFGFLAMIPPLIGYYFIWRINTDKAAAEGDYTGLGVPLALFIWYVPCLVLSTSFGLISIVRHESPRQLAWVGFALGWLPIVIGYTRSYLTGPHAPEPVPLVVAIATPAFMLCVAAYAFLTCFHPAWKRQLRWGHCGRKSCGPVLSRWSHIAAGIWAMVTPWAVVGDSFGIKGSVAAACGVAAGLATAAMIAGMINDCVVHWRKRET
jgi:hypothetical protein